MVLGLGMWAREKFKELNNMFIEVHVNVVWAMP